MTFLDLGEGPSVGGVLCVPAVLSPLVTQAACSGGLREPFCGRVLTAWGVWWTWSAPGLAGRQALPCVDAAGCWLAGSGHEAAGCGILGDPRLVLAPWWAESGSRRPWDAAHPLAGEARSWG